MSSTSDLEEIIDHHLFPAKTPSEGPECPICYENRQESGRPQQRLVSTWCNHVYHSKCIIQWLLYGQRICPMCRRQLIHPEGGYDPSWEKRPLTKVHEDGEAHLYLFARWHVEAFVREYLESTRFHESQIPDRFVRALGPIVCHVIREWKKKFTGPLWDPLPRRVQDIDETAIKARTIMTLLKYCIPEGYLDKPMSNEERQFLTDQRQACWRSHSCRWDRNERHFVLHGIMTCYMKIEDFFPRRHRCETPIDSRLTCLDPCYEEYSEKGEDDIVEDYHIGIPLENFDSNRPIRRIFGQILTSRRGVVYDIETVLEPWTNKVRFYCVDNGKFLQREVEFSYATPSPDILNYFEPGMFNL